MQPVAEPGRGAEQIGCLQGGRPSPTVGTDSRRESATRTGQSGGRPSPTVGTDSRRESATRVPPAGKLMPTPLPLQFFDHGSPVTVIDRDLPHWLQAGTVCFLTWRTWDSMPRGWVDQWLADRAAWLRSHAIDPDRDDWRRRLRQLPDERIAEFNRSFSRRWESCLDEAHGSCPLKRPELSKVVGDSLMCFDGTRYHLTDFVVMPNHVHLLAAFPDDGAMLAQCEGWKRFTGVRLNRLLGRSGRFWQVDGFDHLVRDEAQFEKFRRYIADNPRRAGLMPGEYLWYSTEPSGRLSPPVGVTVGDGDPPGPTAPPGGRLAPGVGGQPSLPTGSALNGRPSPPVGVTVGDGDPPGRTA